MRDIDDILKCYKGYLDEDLFFQDDGLYIGNIRIMTFDQIEIMNKYASSLAKNRTNLRILEVGYGLGEFAGAIEKFNLKEHVIVECHPKICEMARQRFSDSNHVEVWQGFWQSYVPLTKFDSIFYDTTVLDEDAMDSLISFLEWSQEYLSKRGRISFWYCGTKIDSRLFKYLETEHIKYDISLSEASGKHYLIFVIYKKHISTEKLKKGTDTEAYTQL